MARTMRKFSAGGAQGKYDRRMADIKKDFEKDSKGKSGRALEVLEAKRAQRTADAEDDRAKRMGTDRTATRKAEYDAEQRLSRTRRFGADKPAAAAEPAKTEPVKTTAPAAETAKAKPQTFGAAFKDARARLGAGKTFTFNGKSFTTNIAGEGRKPVQRAATPSAAATPAKVEDKPVKIQRNYNVSPENRAAIDAAAKESPFSKLGSMILPRNASKSYKDAAFAANERVMGTPAAAKAKAKAKVESGPSTKRGLNPNSIAGMIASGNIPNPFKGLRFTNDADMRAYYKKQYEERAEGKAKGGKIMKYAKGGSTTSKPPQPSAADRARSKKHLDELKKLKPTDAEGKAVGSANRSSGYAKGGKMASCGMKKGGKATKFGAAMKKKSADTKGRAMMKFAKGGSIDGCAVKGKTKTSMIKMKNGGSC